jgi:hypothetical protein
MRTSSSAPCTIEIVSGHLLRQHAATIREVPVKALTISLVAGAALCGVMSTPASAMPISNLAAAASDLALGQSVRYYRRYGYGYRSYYRYRPSYYTYRPSYYSYGYRPSYYSYGYRSYYGYGYPAYSSYYAPYSYYRRPYFGFGFYRGY